MPSRCLTDATLAARSARGDAAAFAVVYDRHHQALYRYCRSIVHHDEDARDALQTTMLKGFAALQSQQQEVELKPWLFRIAHNEAVSILRRRRPHEVLETALDRGDDSLERSVESRSRLLDLRRDLADLPEKQRAALVLRELSGLSYDEIATVIDSTARNVKQTIFEARTAMHEFRAGREMACDPVRRALSDGDGRVLRGRRIRGHLRSCDGCRSFRSELLLRPGELAALAPPLPIGAGAAMLAQLLPGGTTAAGAGAAGAGAAASASNGLLAGVAGKLAVTAAVATTATGGGAVTVSAVAPAPKSDRAAETAPGKAAVAAAWSGGDPAAGTGRRLARPGPPPDPVGPRSAPIAAASANPQPARAAPGPPSTTADRTTQTTGQPAMSGPSPSRGKATGPGKRGKSASPGKPANGSSPGKPANGSSPGKPAKSAPPGKPAKSAPPGKPAKSAPPGKPAKNAPPGKPAKRTPPANEGKPAAQGAPAATPSHEEPAAKPAGTPPPHAPSAPAKGPPASTPTGGGSPPSPAPQPAAESATTVPAAPSASPHGRGSRPQVPGVRGSSPDTSS